MPYIKKTIMSRKTAIIGSGNPLFKDEGIGLFLAKHIKDNYTFSEALEFVDGSTLGLNLQSYIQEYDHLIIINTHSDKSLKAGTITIRTADDFLQEQQTKQTANEVVIAEMLQVCMLAGDIADITFISITPEDLISVEVGLSESLVLVWDDLVGVVLDEIEGLGIEVSQSAYGLVGDVFDFSLS